jgi:nitronate monooxygenase
LTEALGLRLPILLAPMGFAAGGRLAAAVTAAVMLSFGDPMPHARAIKAAGVVLICQVQTMVHAKTALDCGADIIVAQGSEAGGHGAMRATMTLVPEVADLLARESPHTLLVAAGGIADGRGMAAALMLGADGVMLGSRLWAASECLIHPNHQAAALASDGDGTVRQIAADIARGYDWPGAFTGRVLRNGFVERWHGREEAHRAVADGARAAYMASMMEGRSDEVGVFVGEAIGLMHDVRPAGEIMAEMADTAAALLRKRAAMLLV